MLPITKRAFLQELRDTANGMTVGNLNPDWAREYAALSDAADRLDAMHARDEQPPPGGFNAGEPQNEVAA